MELKTLKGVNYFQEKYNSPKVEVTCPKLWDMLQTLEDGNKGKIGWRNPLNAHLNQGFKGWKSLYTDEELKTLVLFLKKHSPWTYACSRPGGGLTKNMYLHRGYVFFVLKLTTALRAGGEGLLEKSTSYLYSPIYRPSMVFQIEAFKYADWKLARKSHTKINPVYFGYVPARNEKLLTMLDRVMVNEKLV